MATVEELVQYYQDLLIMQYSDKPKAVATVGMMAEEVISDLLPLKLLDCFSLEDAVGVQLDLMGKYTGIVRRGRTFSGPIELDDTDFRSLIKISIAKNVSKSSLYDIQNLLNIFFPKKLLVFDFKNMSMGYFFDSAIGSENLAEMFVINNLLPKPMGVQLGSLIYSNDVASFFGFIDYEQPIQINSTGFNDYTDYIEEWPWLNYNDAIII